MTPRLRIGSLFSGYGGLDLGTIAALEKLGYTASVAWHVEWDDAPGRILAYHWPAVPNYGDVTAVDWSDVEPVDVLTMGFPCQDVSLAGLRKGLMAGTRSGLWSECAIAIAALRPRLVVIENVRGLLSAAAGDKKEYTDDDWEEAARDLESGAFDLGGAARSDRPVLRALGAVLGDLADLGYDARWAGVRASDAGAPHGRFRVFIVAEPADADRDGGRARGDLVGAGVAPSSTRHTGAPDVGHPDPADADALGRERTEQPRGRVTGPADRDRAHADPDVGGRRPVVDHLRAGQPDAAGRRAATDAGHDGLGGLAPAHDDDRGVALGLDVDGRARAAATHPVDVELARERHEQPRRAATSGGGPVATADAERGGGERRGGHGRVAGPTGAGEGDRSERQRDGDAAHDRGAAVVDWGPYGPAIRQWESVTGRYAPEPTNPDGRDGARRLAPQFTEWMMGLPVGHVTDPAIGISRNAQLKACGNGVVPQQATLALDVLLPGLTLERAA